MRLSELFVQLRGVDDLRDFTFILASPTRDGTEVEVIGIGDVAVDYEKRQIRIYPPKYGASIDIGDALSILGRFLKMLPSNADGENDLSLFVEAPIFREDDAAEPVRLVDLQGIHLGRESQEVWLLLRPLSEYPRDVLPT